jgi:putative transposase
MELKPHSHSFGESNFHIVFAPKYRYPVLWGKVAEACKKAFQEASDRWGIQLITYQITADHVHIFAGLGPSQSPAWAVHKLKGIAARRIFAANPWLKHRGDPGEHRFWGGQFWSDGYFFRSVGSTTDKAIQFYIDVANDPVLKYQYYRHKRGTKEPIRREDPYIEHLEGRIKLTRGAQTGLKRFLSN